MRSWPSPYLPPAPKLSHPALSLHDSYRRERIEMPNTQTSMYVCGITPYDATHLGHAATYLTFDIVQRYLRATGAKVSFVENITDIDDPLFERATRDKVQWSDLAQSQIDLFISDMTALRVIPPDVYAGVVENMALIIAAVESLYDKGVTYSLDNDLYLDLSKVPGALEDLPLSQEDALAIFAERGGDPNRPGKRNQLDPLLWRMSNPGEPSWHSRVGEGRPGWHIECVALALHYLPMVEGNSISIQGGGSDLIFPHHYMSAVQARALNDRNFAKAFVHAGMIGLDGEKMSKSRGNLVFVSKLLAQGVRPEAIRWALLSSHYREDRMWSDALLQKAERDIAEVERALAHDQSAPTHECLKEIITAIADDLDTPRALRAVMDWSARTNSGESGGSSGEISRALDLYLGIAL